MMKKTGNSMIHFLSMTVKSMTFMAMSTTTIPGAGTGKTSILSIMIQKKTTTMRKIMMVIGMNGRMITGVMKKTMRTRMVRRVLGGKIGIKRLRNMRMIKSGGEKMGGILGMTKKRMRKKKVRTIKKGMMKGMIMKKRSNMKNLK